jgi:hypothetical protein
VNRPSAGCLLVAALLAGCAAPPAPPPKPEEPSPFIAPAGAPREVRIGFVQGYPADSRLVPVLLLPGAVVADKMRVVARDPFLHPSAVLEITGLGGRIAIARIVRGQPQPRDEVVLPSSELAERSQELPP